jgi:hypothetical protein
LLEGVACARVAAPRGMADFDPPVDVRGYALRLVPSSVSRGCFSGVGRRRSRVTWGRGGWAWDCGLRLRRGTGMGCLLDRRRWVGALASLPCRHGPAGTGSSAVHCVGRVCCRVLPRRGGFPSPPASFPPSALRSLFCLPPYLVSLVLLADPASHGFSRPCFCRGSSGFVHGAHLLWIWLRSVPCSGFSLSCAV